MIKITQPYQIVPCERDPLFYSCDLFDRPRLAKSLAQTASQFFWLKRGVAHFSGYVKDELGLFSIELWDQGRLLRTVEVSGTGFSGVLYVDVVQGTVEEAVGCDTMGELYGVEKLSDAEGLVCSIQGSQGAVGARELGKRAWQIGRGHRKPRPQKSP